MEQASNNGFTGKMIRLWKTNPLFSTGTALLVMIIIQTIVIFFNTANMAEVPSKIFVNWMNILKNNAAVGIISLGMTFAIVSGGIDLSVGSIFVAVGAFTLVMIDTGEKGLLSMLGIGGAFAIVIAVIAATGLGTALGEVNGILIAKGKIPPFIATLGTMQILRSVTQYFMKTRSVSVPSGYLNISSFAIGGHTILPIVYWAVAAVGMYIISKNTAFGRYVFATGSNEKTASFSGINVKTIKRRVYAITGFLVAVAAIIQTSRIGSLDYASAGSGYEMDAIAGVVVGGTSMAGGRGSIPGTVIGVLIVSVMNNLLTLIRVDPYLSTAFKGLIIIAAVIIQRKDKDR